MHFAKVLVSALLGVCASAANVFVVSVSSTSGNLTYSPNKITAKPGDMVQFQFRGGNHTVTQSTFDQPCMPISMFSNTTGIWSGFMPVAASAAQGNIPTYTVMINNTNPMWLYCSQGKHCQNGMVMVINENTAKNQTRSLQNFMGLAKTAKVNLPGDATSATGGQSGTTTGNGTSTGTGSGTGSSTTPSTSAVVGASAGTVLTTPATMSLFGIAAAFFLL